MLFLMPKTLKHRAKATPYLLGRAINNILGGGQICFAKGYLSLRHRFLGLVLAAD